METIDKVMNDANSTHYRMLLLVAEQLILMQPETGTHEADLLEALATAIEQYEAKYFPIG